MKKFYQITGTTTFGENKQSLKAERNELNRRTLGLKPDQALESVPSNQWPHRITKGPEHPHLSK